MYSYHRANIAAFGVIAHIYVLSSQKRLENIHSTAHWLADKQQKSANSLLPMEQKMLG